MSDLEIFIVDDDAAVRRALDRLLRVAGYRVRAFAVGAGRARRSCQTAIRRA